MRLTVVEHPLVWNLLTLLRAENTPNASFRAALHDLTAILIYEALREAPVRRFALRTPVAETEGMALANPPLLVPVLRAGLGMVSAATGLIPNAQVGFVGIAREEDTHRPVPYMESLPEDLSQTPVVILDPMVATGGSLRHTVELLVERGAGDITAVCVVGAPEGIHALEQSGLPLRMVAAAVDEGLNENAYIVPGLGDAGDRQFGPR